MNPDNILRVAAAIEDEANEFCMAEPWICIGGRTQELFVEGGYHESMASIDDTVAEVFEISEQAANALCFGSARQWPERFCEEGRPIKATRTQASAMLRAIASGEVIFDDSNSWIDKPAD